MRDLTNRKIRYQKQMNRKCPSCNLIKETNEFGFWGGRICAYCRKCHAIKGTLWNRNKKIRNGTFKYAHAKTEAERLERKKVSSRKWIENNKEKYHENIRKWKLENPHLEAARVRYRQAMKLKATPKWADQFIMNEAYHLAVLRTKVTGIKWHVDHIVPLKSKIVCGFHTHTNLQVIPASQNLKKNNRFWPNMPVEP